MPYANRTAFARQLRAYIVDKKRRLPEGTVEQYGRWIEQHGETLRWKPPLEITVRDLENLEMDLMGRFSESTVSVRMTVMREFLVWTGNKTVHKYRKICSLQPARDSIFLTEGQMAMCRLKARELSTFHELVFSLMVDNGMRPTDVMRLTMQNAREFLNMGESMILGKGRNGGKLAKMVISPLTLPPLKRYLLQRRGLKGAEALDQLILVEYHGKASPVSRTWLYKTVRSVMEPCGVDASPRDLRKTCGNRVYHLTRDVAMAAMILRHGSPDVTFKHYIGADSVEMRDVQARLASQSTEGQRT